MGIILCALLAFNALLANNLIQIIGFSRMSASGGLFTRTAILVTMLSVVLPILYIVGGNRNKRSPQA
ncbi:MAG: hypothetical protein FWE85_01065 [Clostridiales bacterium]|nr:hypothetical protein [Clostridiales bacterium]